MKPTRKALKSQAPDCRETGKRSFYTREAAEFFRGAYRACRVYQCPFCDLWHLTTQPLKVRR